MDQPVPLQTAQLVWNTQLVNRWWPQFLTLPIWLLGGEGRAFSAGQADGGASSVLTRPSQLGTAIDPREPPRQRPTPSQRTDSRACPPADPSIRPTRYASRSSDGRGGQGALRLVVRARAGRSLRASPAATPGCRLPTKRQCLIRGNPAKAVYERADRPLDRWELSEPAPCAQASRVPV